MFPNIRVMIAALLASVAGISCGLGALAAFRVNHQPFTRMQSANPPLQLAFGTGLTDEVTDGRPAPFDVRFQVISRPPIQPALAGLSNAAPPATAANPVGDQQARLETKPQPNEPAHQDGDVAPISSLVATPVSAAVTAVDRSAPAETAAADGKPAAAEASPADPVTAAKTENAASVEPRPAPLAASDSGESAKPNLRPATPVSAEKEAPRHIVKLHRRRRPRPATAAAAPNQNFGSPIPQFQWQGSALETPPTASQMPPPLKHVIAKRHRPVKKAVAGAASAEQTASGDAAIRAARR
jgi:hypothetical protein